MLDNRPLFAVALMGATGTGKSALAMQLAKSTGSSIISCDSMQVYRGLDIGTAKPTMAEREQVPHYLVDCCDLPDNYSAARWAAEVKAVIAKENEQQRLPLIVGGTGLYLKALLAGFAEIPAEKPEIRQKYEQLQQQSGTAALYQILEQQDGETAARLAPGDTQRIMRALSVLESSGKPLSAWQREQGANAADIHCPVFVLDVERELLRQRLGERFQAMLHAGWLKEVDWLAGLQLAETHPAMRACGYRQLLEFVNGRKSLEQSVIDGITATRRYAKRQVTWFAHQTPDAMHGNADLLETIVLEALNREW